MLLLCSILLQFTDSLTREHIELNRHLATEKLLKQVLPLKHDNNLLQDSKEVTTLSSTVYRARQSNKNVGLVFMPLDVPGYSGNIRLALGVTQQGNVSGVRVISHRETTGLGDTIHQDVSPWILNFDGRSLANTPAQGWAVTSEGGEFDAISGATITPRVVINKIRAALLYYQQNRDELYR